MRRLLIPGLLLAGYSFAWARKSGIVKLKHFSSTEFAPWWPMMNRQLVQTLDDLRGRWGYPILISPALGSLGRTLGPGNESQHNVTMWGEVRGADVMPKTLGADGKLRGLIHGSEREIFFNLAADMGFTGIGVYPAWKPYPGFHLDVRKNRVVGDPARWAGVPGDGGKQAYVDVNRAFV